MSGIFITLEGIDGSGKSTQARLLLDWVRRQRRRARLTREPGGTEVGAQLRGLVLSPDNHITPEAELFLYLADRSLHAAQVIQPALAAGEIVICERHTDSTLAYQGYGRGLDLALLRQLNSIATGGLLPDLTIILDITPSQARLDATRLDRLESEGEEFGERVAEGFRALARAEPERIRLVDGRAEIDVVHTEVTELVSGLLRKRQATDAEEGS